MLICEKAGGVTTGFLVEHEQDVSIPPPSPPSPHLLVLAAYSLMATREGKASHSFLPLIHVHQLPLLLFRTFSSTYAIPTYLPKPHTGPKNASPWVSGAWRAFGERTLPLDFVMDGIDGMLGLSVTVHQDGKSLTVVTPEGGKHHVTGDTVNHNGERGNVTT